MQNNQKQILDLIIHNIMDSIHIINIESAESTFLIEKVLTNCGLSTEHSSDVISHVKSVVKENTNKTSTDLLISTEVKNFIDTLFEASRKDRLDKIAVRNKQSGAIQLVSKKTYQSNSQLYTPLSAGWAKANVIMIRNKTSGEEYPVLLKNFDPNKHEKLTTATPFEKDKEKSDLDSKPFSVQKGKKEPKKPDAGQPEPGKSTVRPMMVEPGLKAKTQTAFITKKTDTKEPYTGRVQDKSLTKTDPIKSKSFIHPTYHLENEFYDDMKAKNLLPAGFNLKNAFKIPKTLLDDLKLPSAYIPTIEQLINTKGGNENPLSVYFPNMPLGFNPNAAISLFELLLLFSVTLNDEDFAKFKIQLEMFLNKSSESNLSFEIWEIVQKEREFILKYLMHKYGRNFKLVAASWKVEENLIDLGIDNSDIDTERVSDIFLRITKENNDDVLEEFVVTPNKNNTIALLNKEKFSESFNEIEAKTKDKLMAFMLKVFPIEAILKNYASVVFPDIIYDYFSLSELFKTDEYDSIDFSLKISNNNIILTSKIENKNVDVLHFEIASIVLIKIDDSFYNEIKKINKKIYKTN
jgi:hypothetical protein